MKENKTISEVISSMLPILEYLKQRGIIDVKVRSDPEVYVTSKLFKEMFGDVPRSADGYVRTIYNGILFRAWIPPEDA